VREFDGQGGLSATPTLEGDPYLLPTSVANTLLQIAREALSNVVRHARATRVDARLTYAERGVTFAVTDDGAGFDVPTAGRDGHFGLENLQYRAEEVGGHLSIDSTPGAGAQVVAFIPAPRAERGNDPV
ncbi:MAG TPA: ATP-binding protein, partial [Chloroflexota bacterium]|nr:ATP-binding protein [Chloroflexota bacterium]